MNTFILRHFFVKVEVKEFHKKWIMQVNYFLQIIIFIYLLDGCTMLVQNHVND
jgi:hypothetical protein